MFFLKRIIDPPRLHQQLGANWVEVTKELFRCGNESRLPKACECDIDNAASNNRVGNRDSLHAKQPDSFSLPENYLQVAFLKKGKQPGSINYSLDSVERRFVKSDVV